MMTSQHESFTGDHSDEIRIVCTFWRIYLFDLIISLYNFLIVTFYNLVSGVDGKVRT